MDLPVVDLAPYLQITGDTAPAVAAEEVVHALCATVSASLRDTGALLVKDPRCSAADNDRFLDVVERYFARSDDSKRLQERPQLHYQVGVTPEGVEVPRSLVDKEMQDKIKSMPDEFQPATPKGPDPKWRYMWRVGPRPANTRFKELNSEPVIPDGLPEWKETMDSWGSKMISAIEVVAEMAAIGFGLSKDAFTSLMKEGPHLLAPTGSDLLRHGSEGTVFAGFHYDLNFLTIHGRSRFLGLNIWLRNGKKMEVKVPVGCLLIQSGKQAEWLTGDNLHSYFDYSAGMQGLFGRSVSPVQDIVVGKFESALLCLSSLQCYFGHPKKALEAFAEAARVSQMNNDDSCLAYVISNLLSKIGMSYTVGIIRSPYSLGTNIGLGTPLSIQQQLLVLLKRSLKRADKLKLPSLLSFDHLSLAKFDLKGGAASVACRRPQYITLPRRFYRTWSRTSQDPPPILQLTFHNEYDCKMETTVPAELFFKLRRLVYSIPADKLIEMSDGYALLLSEFSKSFLRAAALVAHGNYRRGYCIAPSFTSDNIDVFFATGSCVLKVAKWFYLNEVVNGSVMSRLTSYSALANYFIDILKRVEGPDVMDKLSPIVKDLFQKMTGVIDPLLIHSLEDLILNHPALMSTEGCVNVILEAESLLKKQLLCSGIAADILVARKIFSSQAYLWSNTYPRSAMDPCPEGAWIAVALKHVALRHWYEFNWKQQNARQSDLKARYFQAYNIKKGKHDAQAIFQLAESGKKFVSLWRNGIAHYAEVELKEKLLKVLGSGKLAKAWPIKKQVVIAMFIVNYPMFLPKYIESFAHAKLLQELNLHNCWPRQLRSYGYTPLQIAGLNSVLLKSGLRHFHARKS